MNRFKTAIMLLLLLGLLSEERACKAPKELYQNPKSPRIVSLAPNLTEIVFALGMGDHLVGVTDHCNYPALAKTKPKLGGLKTISLEAVLAQEPDLVLGTRDGNESAFLDKLSELGLRVKTFEPSNLEEVLRTILELGEELGRRKRAEQLVKELREEKAEVEKKLEGVRPVRVFLFFSHEPLIASGPKTFAHDLIQTAGGINLAQDAQIPYPQYSLELVIEKSPEVIIDVSMGEIKNAQEEATRYWQRWPELPAVKNHRVYALNSDLITRPGPRLFQGLREMAQLLHPECFSTGR